MSKDALAFVAGLGTGYLTQRNRNRDDEREDKKDARDAERHEAAMDEVKAKRKTRQAMADAGAERKVIDGTAVDTGAGKNLYTDPAQAAAAADDARIEAEMRGQDPAKVTTMAAKGITGDMSQGQQITTGPVDVAKLNTREAQDTRAVANLRGIGDFEKASQLEGNIRTGKVQDMQLKQGEEAQERDKAFRDITNQFVRGGWGAVPKIYEGYNDGNTAQVKPDGKGGALVTTFNAKGEKVGEQAFANEMEFISTAIANVDPKLWVGMREKKAEGARADAKDDRKQTEVERHNKALEGIYRDRNGKTSAGGADGAGVPQIGLKDRRDYLSDFGGLLTDPKTAASPEESGAIMDGNKRALAQADAIFTANAQLGTVLTAPQAATAMKLAQDKKNVSLVRDNATGKTYESVKVNGAQVIVGEVAKITPPAAPGPKAPPAPGAANVASSQGAAPAQDPLAGQKIGMLTPMSMIQQSAKAGNPQAIEYLRRAQAAALADSVAPRDTASMMNGQ